MPTGIISHGGAFDWALMSYKAMVNDTIANALDIFPVQKYDWSLITQKLSNYIELVLKEV